MASFHTKGVHGYSVKFSPFTPSKLACVACQQYGIAGNAALFIFEFNPELQSPPTLLQVLDWSDGLFDVCWSEVDENVCVTAGGDGAIQLWNTTQKLPVIVLRDHQKEVYSVDWNHKGNKNLIVSGSWDNSSKIWDVSSGAKVPLSTYNGHFGVVYSTVWSPYMPDCFATTSGDGTARVWDVRKPYMPLNVLAAHQAEVLSCDWSKYDENILVTGSVDCSIKVWDIRNSKQFVCQMLGHTYAVRRVKCCPFMAGVVASCSYDFSVRTWNFLKPQGFAPLLEKIEHHTEFVYGVDFSTFVPGLIADCAWDETVKIYKPQSML